MDRDPESDGTRALTRGVPSLVRTNSSELVRRGLADFDAIQQKLIRPSWRFAERPSCGAVQPDGDKLVVVGDAGRSVLHALAHLRIRMIATSGRPLSQRAVQTIESWADVHDGLWSDEQEERFAEASEAYMAQRAPVFGITSNIQFAPELEAAFLELYPLPDTAVSTAVTAPDRTADDGRLDPATSVEILPELKARYQGCLRPEITSIRFRQNKDLCFIEVRRDAEDSVDRLDLDFIVEDQETERPVFDPLRAIDDNARRFVENSSLTAAVTDLFTSEAADAHYRAP
jgi:hypothetical protein